MKKDYTRTELKPTNEAEVLEFLKGKVEKTEVLTFIRLLSQVCDEAAENGDCWITLGATRNRDALVLALHQGRSTAYASGATFLEVVRAAGSLL